MDVIRHDDIASDTPERCRAPGVDNPLHRILVREQWFTLMCADS